MEDLIPFLLSGAAAHLIYRFCEPRKPHWHFALLLLAPLLVAVLFVLRSSCGLLAVFMAWFTYISSLVFCTVIYRLSPFHPLAKYPGPVICKISKIYMTSVAFRGIKYIYVQELHRRYGDIVRIGPNELSFCNPEYIAPIFGPGGMPKAPFWDGIFSHQGAFRTYVAIRDPRSHSRIRRMWLKGFTPEAIRSYQPILDKRVGQLINLLGERVDQTVDLARWMNWFSYDMMNDLAFGDDINMMQNQDHMGLLDTMGHATSLVSVMGQLPWVALFLQGIAAVARAVEDFREFSRQRVLKRVKSGTSHKDLFYHIMDEGREEPTQDVIKQIANDAALIMVAGSDTVAPALSSIFYFLMCNPITHARLQTEIDNSGLSWEDVDGLARLPYLNAVLREALRLIPPVLGGTQRAPLIGSGGFMVDSHFIPEGTTVGIHTYTLQRDSRNFSLPDRFLPERWLPIEKQLELEPEVFKDRDQVIHNVNAFIAFSYGPADCIGKRVAWQELRAVTCAVLQRFTFQFPKGYDKTRWEADIRELFTLEQPKMPSVLTPRVESSK